MKEEQDEKEKTVEPAGWPQVCTRQSEAGRLRPGWTESEQRELLIRPISVPDLEQILEIEQASYRTPWTSSDFLARDHLQPNGLLLPGGGRGKDSWFHWDVAGGR